jgi:hypothetical protein
MFFPRFARYRNDQMFLVKPERNGVVAQKITGNLSPDRQHDRFAHGFVFVKFFDKRGQSAQ